MLFRSGAPVTKPRQTVRVGDVVAVPQRGWRRTVRVLALGVRRGPAAEARILYEEAEVAVRLHDPSPDWAPLLADNETDLHHATCNLRDQSRA